MVASQRIIQIRHPIAWEMAPTRTNGASRRSELAYSLYAVQLLIVVRCRIESPDERATYFVLASLLDGPLHGYAIIQRTKNLSGGRIRLATGTLYTALDRSLPRDSWS
jgi:hypothetical protein